MDDDWDDSPSSNGGAGVADSEGTKFSSGRGFKPVESSNGEWGGFGNSGDDDFGGNRNRGDRGGRGGRGNRGGRGGGRGRGGGGFRNRDDNGFDDAHENGGSSWGKSDHFGGDDGGFGGGDGGGRGGRGRGRGGRGGRGGGRRDDDGDSDRKPFGGGGDKEDGEPQKPREIYIPPDRVIDEELFASTISSGENFKKLDDNVVKVSGENVPEPIASFENSGLRPHLLENVKKSGYTHPTPIQKYAISIIMAGRDLMGCAQTGSGKTAAFLLPMINKIMASQDSPVTNGTTCEPKVVIVAPTRELVIQIDEQAKKFAYNSIVKTAVAYGGASVSYQKNKVQAGCHILTATPGRLNDFVSHGHISFASVEFFVLDEADRMLDMGFLPTVEQMLGHASMISTGERQTLMFSATFPEAIQHLAGKFLHNYIFVAVGIVGSASTDVEQRFFQVDRSDKRNKLIELLEEGKNERTVVFVETKKNTDFLAALLCEKNIQATSIHGDRLQSEREQALWDFKKGIRNILMATGVAARGLDIDGVQHVINYDLPNSIDEYVHRIGRTGRVGNRGKATSLFEPSRDGALAGSLSLILKQAGQEVPEWLNADSFGGGMGGDGFGGRDIRGDDFGKAQDFVQQPAEQEDDEW